MQSARDTASQGLSFAFIPTRCEVARCVVLAHERDEEPFGVLLHVPRRGRRAGLVLKDDGRRKVCFRRHVLVTRCEWREGLVVAPQQNAIRVPSRAKREARPDR